jgi:hypothetical protein
LRREEHGQKKLYNFRLSPFPSRIAAIDPATGEDVPLFHPIRQLWPQHFRLKGYQIKGLTAVGRATVEALNLNHSRRQRIREVEEAFGLYPPTR